MRTTRRRLAAAASSAVLLALSTASVASAQPGDPAGAASGIAAGEFSGTVALSNCSGSIVRWSSSSADDLALMLTNGHCYDFLDAGEVIIDQPSSRNVHLLNGDGSEVATVQTTTLVYATMTKTDVSLYRLGLTYQQLEDQYGVPALTLSDHQPKPKKQKISIVSGYWTTVYTCHMNKFSYRLHEYVWTWNKSIRYEDGSCQVIGGTSGSPILNKKRVQIGINNTINEEGERCTLNNPCEENRKGKISVHLHRGYGQQTWWFYTCLSGTTLDLDKKGCKLPS